MSARRQIIAALSEDSHGGIATLQDVTRAERLVAAFTAEVRRADAARLLSERAQYASRDLFCKGIEHSAERLTRWAAGAPAAGVESADRLAALTEGQEYPGQLAILRGLLATLHAVAEHGDLADVRKLLDERDAHTEAGETTTTPAATATPADTNRRARLLHAMDPGGRWKSGDVVRWYAEQGLPGFGVRAARHDLAILRDSGAITEHNEKGVRFYTRQGRRS